MAAIPQQGPLARIWLKYRSQWPQVTFAKWPATWRAYRVAGGQHTKVELKLALEAMVAFSGDRAWRVFTHPFHGNANQCQLGFRPVTQDLGKFFTAKVCLD